MTLDLIKAGSVIIKVETTQGFRGAETNFTGPDTISTRIFSKLRRKYDSKYLLTTTTSRDHRSTTHIYVVPAEDAAAIRPVINRAALIFERRRQD